MLFIISTLSEIVLELGIAAAIVLICYAVAKFTTPKKEEEPILEEDYEDQPLYVVPNRDKLFDAVVREYCKE
jgi:hypothetical protein